MWDTILLVVVLLAIGAMVFLPTIGNTLGTSQESKCSSCPKKAARDAMGSQ
jgi:hypothetical protein